MHILLYHKHKEAAAMSVTDRAAARAHILRKTIWWDVGLLLLLAVSGMLCYWYAPVLRNIPAIAWLVPVNGSPWEQLKPLFWPVCITAFVRQFCTGKLQRGILTTYAGGITQAMGGFVTGYYVANGIWGKEIPFLVLFLFWLNAVVLLVYLRRTADHQQHGSWLGAVMLLMLAVCFIVFTYVPPQIGLFQELCISI